MRWMKCIGPCVCGWLVRATYYLRPCCGSPTRTGVGAPFDRCLASTLSRAVVEHVCSLPTGPRAEEVVFCRQHHLLDGAQVKQVPFEENDIHSMTKLARAPSKKPINSRNQMMCLMIKIPSVYNNPKKSQNIPFCRRIGLFPKWEMETAVEGRINKSPKDQIGIMWGKHSACARTLFAINSIHSTTRG